MDYKEDLRKRLPELKKIEGFPVGEEEDIINLSNPPFFTACPNPYIEEFINRNGTKYNESKDNYHREPFVGDVSEGKNGAVYNAHSYHTKVPYKAINKFIEHFTNKGDIILDGFSGTGSAGFSANILNRHSILNDLGPAASLISYGYVKPVQKLDRLKEEFSRIYDEVKKEVKWMFTSIVDGKEYEIQNTIWSDNFSCNFCNYEYVFSDLSLDFENKKIISDYKCPSCNADISKSSSNNVFLNVFDESLGERVEIGKKTPILIQGKRGTTRKEKEPDEIDLKTQEKIDSIKIPYWFPIIRMPEGDEARRNDPLGYKYVHQFFTKRNLYTLSAILNRIEKSTFKYDLLFVFQSCIQRATITNRFRFGGTGGLSGTLYIPSLIIERAVLPLFKNKFKDYVKLTESKNWNIDKTIVTNQSTTDLKNIPENSIDYIFTDPPFGSNLMYSELSFWWEAWLKVISNNKKEAIMNKTQNKKLEDYGQLMLDSFQEYSRVLKPKRWISVVFHNSKSSVWNSIQENLSRAGFIVAQVGIIDKKQESFKQITAPGAVSNDLVISAFKPSASLIREINMSEGSGMELNFIHEFLENLPVKMVIERTSKMLYSKYLSFYIQRSYQISYNSVNFYELLNNNFKEEDGFWFTSNQINSFIEYKKKMNLEGIEEVKSGAMMLFVSDEKSALLWLYNYLTIPKTYSDIHPAFTQIASIQGDLVPELSQLLEDNFIKENNVYRRPTSKEEHSTLNTKREKVLIREFESLLLRAKSERKKIKEVRKEALLLGFEVCYKEKRFKDILLLSNRLDNNIIENSSEINDFVEAAKIMVEGIS